MFCVLLSYVIFCVVLVLSFDVVGDVGWLSKYYKFRFGLRVYVVVGSANFSFFDLVGALVFVVLRCEAE